LIVSSPSLTKFSGLSSCLQVLLRSIPSLLKDTLDICLEAIKTNEHNVNTKQCLIQWLSFMVKSKDLIPVFRNELSKELQETAQFIDNHTAGGPLHSTAGILSMEVQTLLGFKS